MTAPAGNGETGRASSATSNGKAGKRTFYCAFCCKSQHEVRKLIAGPAAVCICDECVALGNEIIARGPPAQPAQNHPARGVADRAPAGAPASHRGRRSGKGNPLQQVVDILRAR
jgi:hypothetical protein